MPGYEIHKPLFKELDSNRPERFVCSLCEKLLRDPVQVGCGHRFCQSCADDIIKSTNRPKCSLQDCGEEFSEEDGVYVSILRRY